ncbi:MAG: DUF2335 domain-containing protein [Verrucomicrobiales bacterium]|nr:DUF2335 domain-containing protein [Verrucomicrobiales bacterium]
MQKIESAVIKADPQLASLNKGQKQAVVKAVRQIQGQVYSGPIPPPEQLRQFNEIISNGADRIMKMAESQANQRMKTDGEIVRWQLFGNILGQVLAFLIAIGGLFATVYLAINNHEWVASIVGGTTIVGLVAAFIKGQNAQNK